MRNKTATAGLTAIDIASLMAAFVAVSEAARAAGHRWAATDTAIRRVAAAQRRVLYQHRERAERARVLALYDRFL